MSDDLIRWMNATDTAKRLGVKETALPRLVRLGRIPKPDYALGTRSPRWDLEAIDFVFGNVLKSPDVNHRNGIQANVEKILSEGRSRRHLQKSGRNDRH